jgi:hypothetical protein
MTRMTKYLIFDKTNLYASTERLCRFVETHNVILPEVLFYECLTTQEQKRVMLDRCRQMVLAGASLGPGMTRVLRTEATELRPYGLLVDGDHNDEIHQTFKEYSKPYDPKIVAAKCQEEREFVAWAKSNVELCTRHFKTHKQAVLQEEIGRWLEIDQSRFMRLRERAEFLDTQDLHDAANTLLPGITHNPQKYCLSDAWVSWHFVRVALIWFMERAFLHQARGRLKKKDLCGDWADDNYVTLLCRAEGLVTNDRFWQDLTRAAFPEKDVFSSLEEVPESYRRDSAGS